MSKKIAANPFISSIYTADPSAHTWDGEKIYVYASHDIDPPQGCDFMDRYHVFSSTDMVTWEDEGEILCSGDVKWGRPEGGFMWAPDCAYKDGMYYFYFPHPSGSDWNNTWKIGVATSRYPNKDFTERGYINGLGGFALIDPCVFTDDDGQSYIYIGGGGRYMAARLNSDMMSLKEDPVDMEGLHDFHEATWVFKRNGVYYLTYSDNTQPYNFMRYAISDNPMGPWEHKGTYLGSVGCETSHGSVVKFKGEWYQFYHCQDISKQGTLRSMCVDKLFFGDEGEILFVEQTRDGIVSYSIPESAETYPLEKLERTADDSLLLRNADGKSGGRSTIWVRYTSTKRLSKFKLIVNGQDMSYINLLEINGISRLTVTLKPGCVNEIILKEIEKDISISDISISYSP